MLDYGGYTFNIYTARHVLWGEAFPGWKMNLSSGQV